MWPCQVCNVLLDGKYRRIQIKPTKEHCSSSRTNNNKNMNKTKQKPKGTHAHTQKTRAEQSEHWTHNNKLMVCVCVCEREMHRFTAILRERERERESVRLGPHILHQNETSSRKPKPKQMSSLLIYNLYLFSGRFVGYAYVYMWYCLLNYISFQFYSNVTYKYTYK